MSFITVMKRIGHDIKVAFVDVVKYLPAAANVAQLIFPDKLGLVAEVVSAVGLVIQTLVTVEQKFAASGQNESGAQKLAQVLSIVTPTVLTLFAKAGITADSALVSEVVNAVVAILNVSLIAA